MPIPNLTPAQIAQVSDLVAQYISAQRKEFSSRAHALSAKQKTALSGFFTEPVLENTRILELPSGERVPNPDFYPTLKEWGFDNLPDQSGMGAITFSDVVVSHEPFSSGLLFHELVHVEQYRLLGIPRFSELYVCGFINGGSYEAIPLEVNAYTLEDRYRTNPTRRFSVSEEVQQWHAQGKLQKIWWRR